MFKLNREMSFFVIGIFMLFSFDVFASEPTTQKNNSTTSNNAPITKEQAIAIAKKVAERAEKKLNIEDMVFKAEFMPNSNHKDTFHPFVAKSKDFDDKTGIANNLMDGVENISAEQSKLSKNGYWRITYYPKGQKFEGQGFKSNWSIRIINVDGQSGDTTGPLSIQ